MGLAESDCLREEKKLKSIDAPDLPKDFEIVECADETKCEAWLSDNTSKFYGT